MSLACTLMLVMHTSSQDVTVADPGAGPPEAICGWSGLETVSDVSSLTMRLALDVVSHGQSRVWLRETTLDVRPQRF